MCLYSYAYAYIGFVYKNVVPGYLKKYNKLDNHNRRRNISSLVKNKLVVNCMEANKCG